jgi:hypothetical protein
MSAVEPVNGLIRISDSDRDHAIDLLRDGVVAGRLSHDTFAGRMARALAARTAAELTDLVADLPRPGRVQGRVVALVTAVSRFLVDVRSVWRRPRLPSLALSRAGDGKVRIGRLSGCELYLDNDTVSRNHAEFRRIGEHWEITDLGSRNGTHVNGRRVVGTVRVADGDVVGFGAMSFRLDMI